MSFVQMPMRASHLRAQLIEGSSGLAPERELSAGFEEPRILPGPGRSWSGAKRNSFTMGMRLAGGCLVRGHGFGGTLSDCGKGDLWRNLLTSSVYVANIGRALPDDVVHATVEAALLVLVFSWNVGVGSFA